MSDSRDLCFVNVIRIAATVEHPVPHIQVCVSNIYEPLEIRKMSEVTAKCLLLVVDDITYVCDFPNFCEVL